MGYKTPDELTNTSEGIVQGIGKALSIWQGWNSIMDSVAYREDRETARKKAITDSTISSIDKVGVAMTNAIQSGDTRLAGEYNKQIKEMGNKIKDTGDPRIRTAYKTYRTLGDDIANDIKVMDEWDSYVTGAEATGGTMSYDFFASQTTKAGLDRAIQKSREDLRNWRKTLTTNNISNISDHKGWITRHEAMLDRLTQIAGVDGTLPTSATAEERQMFIASITGEGYKTPKDTYDHLEKTNNIRKDLVTTNELSISTLDNEINRLRYQKDPLMSDAEAQDQISQKETLMQNLIDKNLHENTLIKEADAKLADKAYDWAGRGENGYNFDTEDWSLLGDAEKKALDEKSDILIALQSEGEKSGWEEPKGGFRIENGSAVYENGELYTPKELSNLHKRATDRKIEYNTKKANDEATQQEKDDIKTLGKETFGQLKKLKLPTNVADYDLTEKEFNENVANLNDAHKVLDYHTVIKENYEKGLKETTRIDDTIKNIQEIRQAQLKNKEIKKHSDEWKATEKRISKLQQKRRELKIQAGTLKGKWMKFWTERHYTDRQLKEKVPKSINDASLRHDFSQKELDKLELKVISFTKSVDMHTGTLRDNIIQP